MAVLPFDHYPREREAAEQAHGSVGPESEPAVGICKHCTRWVTESQVWLRLPRLDRVVCWTCYQVITGDMRHYTSAEA
jgi:hypothetical protein